MRCDRCERWSRHHVYAFVGLCALKNSATLEDDFCKDYVEGNCSFYFEAELEEIFEG
ncbi:MAG: hypothetical protein PWQ22_1670 [Archaeoglobaceae archaeon]|nr:hypothetical protein [Archaeoglobaceae archaeon]